MYLSALHELAKSGDFEAALAAAETVEGTEEERLEALCIKAWCLSRLGHQSAALAEATKALAQSQESLGPTHSVTLDALNDVARFSARCSDLRATVTHGKDVYARRVEVFGEYHPKTLTSLANLLRYRVTLGETVPSSELAAMKAGWQAADPGTVDPAHLNAWALWAELTKDSVAAATCLGRFEDVLGVDHPDTIRARAQLSAIEAPDGNQS